MEEIHDRVDGFLETLIPEIHRRYPGKHTRILLVSHAATIIALTRGLLGDRSLPMRPGCCSLTEVTRKEGAEKVVGGWAPERLADGAHLSKGSTRDWGFEDVEIDKGKVCLCSISPHLVVSYNEDEQVVADPGVPGTENDVDDSVGRQVQLNSNL